MELTTFIEKDLEGWPYTIGYLLKYSFQYKKNQGEIPSGEGAMTVLLQTGRLLASAGFSARC